MTRDFWKDGFTAADFDTDEMFDSDDTRETAADIANAIIKAEMEKAVEVYEVTGAR